MATTIASKTCTILASPGQILQRKASMATRATDRDDGGVSVNHRFHSHRRDGEGAQKKPREKKNPGTRGTRDSRPSERPQRMGVSAGPRSPSPSPSLPFLQGGAWKAWESRAGGSRLGPLQELSLAGLPGALVVREEAEGGPPRFVAGGQGALGGSRRRTIFRLPVLGWEWGMGMLEAFAKADQLSRATDALLEAGERARVAQERDRTKSRWFQAKNKIHEAKLLLRRLSPQRGLNRDSWLEVGKSLFMVGSQLLPHWAAWTLACQRHGTSRPLTWCHTEEDCHNAWAKFRPSTNLDAPPMREARRFVQGETEAPAQSPSCVLEERPRSTATKSTRGGRRVVTSDRDSIRQASAKESRAKQLLRSLAPRDLTSVRVLSESGRDLLEVPSVQIILPAGGQRVANGPVVPGAMFGDSLPLSRSNTHGTAKTEGLGPSNQARGRRHRQGRGGSSSEQERVLYVPGPTNAELVAGDRILLNREDRWLEVVEISVFRPGVLVKETGEFSRKFTRPISRARKEELGSEKKRGQEGLPSERNYGCANHRFGSHSLWHLPWRRAEGESSRPTSTPLGRPRGGSTLVDLQRLWGAWVFREYGGGRLGTSCTL
ncbi:unnamed protein product [Discosporangium mesarthrocarpum]